jgi:threonine/homoserine/homoserine lactone efflux protein
VDDRLIAFIGVAVAVVVIPGPDMALIARNVLRHGRSAGFATSLGTCTGILGWAVAAALGISALLASSAAAFTALKLAGAAYLIYLGISTLRDHDVRGPAAGASGGGAGLTCRAAWLQGLLSALLNPKLGVFFLTLLPQFIGPADPPGTRALQLALVFDLIGLAWLLAYSAMLGTVGTTLNRPGPRRLIRWISGTVLVGLGARVALERT